MAAPMSCAFFFFAWRCSRLSSQSCTSQSVFCCILHNFASGGKSDTPLRTMGACVRSTSVLNVLTLTLVGPMLFFKYPPPRVVPHPLSFPGGGGAGDRHLVNPKFFVAAYCVVVWVAVLWGTTTCIPCTHGRTFCSLSLKWNTTMFPPGTSVMFIRRTGEPVLAQVVGHSEQVMHIAASLMTVMARLSCTTVRLFGASHCNFCACKCACTVGVWSPKGGWGTVTW